jgi:hypothetical protein
MPVHSTPYMTATSYSSANLCYSSQHRLDARIPSLSLESGGGVILGFHRIGRSR